MNEVIFKSEIPIATNNERIFDETFVIEQWFRRILFTAIKIQYGSNWMDFFNKKEVKAFNKDLRKIENKPMLENDGSNIIWFTSINELAEYMENQEIAYIIERLTATDPEVLTDKLKSIKEIRNTMAHHRTITNHMWIQFKIECGILEKAIDNFKNNFVYNMQPIRFKEESGNQLIYYFNDISYDQFNQNGIQAFITEGDYYLEMYHLPAGPGGPQLVIDHQSDINKQITKFIAESNEAALRLPEQELEFLDIEFMVETFKEFFDDIIGIFINKSQAEFYIVLPKKDIEACLDKFKAIADRFFVLNNKNINSVIPYEQQNAKYICNPMIWFYENVQPEMR